MEESIFKLTDRQLQQVANVLTEAGTVVAASVVLPAILDGFNPLRILTGLIIIGVLWLISINIIK